MSSIEVWQKRAMVAEWLASVLAYPTADLAVALVSEEVAQSYAELPLPESGVPLLTEYAQADVEETLERLRREYTALFLTAPVARISPNAGVWAARDAGSKPMLFNGREEQTIERCYKDFGLASRMVEPPDHIATCMEFVEFLCAHAGGLVRSDAPRTIEQYAEAAIGFASDHLAFWVPLFVAAVRGATNEPLYRVAADALELLVDQLSVQS